MTRSCPLPPSVLVLAVLLTLVVGEAPAESPSPRTVEDFEAEAVPQGWSASIGGSLAITSERFKHGGRSLRWTWERPAASITWTCPEAFAGAKLVENFNCWLYNEMPVQQVLHLEFLDAGKQRMGFCWWPINFRGWRPLGAPYQQVFGNLESLRRVVGIRCSAPEGMPQGRLYVDFMRTRSGGHVIWDLQHPWCFFAGRLDTPAPERFIYSPYDLALNHPAMAELVPEDRITPEQRRDVIRVAQALERQNAIMAAQAGGASSEGIPREEEVPDDAYVFPKDFYPDSSAARSHRDQLPPGPAAVGKGPHPKVVQLCERFRQAFRLQRKDGRLTGRPIDGRNIFSIPTLPDAIGEEEIRTWAGELAGAYANANQHADAASAQAAWEAFRDLCEYALDQGAAAGGMNGPSGDFGHGSIATMREPLEKAGLYREVVIANLWAHVGYIPITERISRPGDASIGGTGNTDFIYGSYNTILRLIMNLPPAERLQYLQGFSRILSMICDQQSPMCAYEPFEIDGAFIHHDMFNLHYGGAGYETLCNLASVLSRTRFQLTPGAVDALKRTAVLLAFLGNTAHAAPNASGYCGDIKRCTPISRVEELARLGTPDGAPIDPDMAALYLGLAQPYLSLSQEVKTTLADRDAPPLLSEDPVVRRKLDIRHVEATAREFAGLGFRPAPPVGHCTVNSAAGAIHRRDRWSVTIFGLTHLHRGMENSGAYPRSIYNRYIRNGSAFVISSGTPPSPYASGCRLQGWDWRFIPGATSLLTDPLRTCGGYTPWRDYGDIKRPSSQPKPKDLSLAEVRAQYATEMEGGTDLDGDGIWGFACLMQSPGVRFRKSAFCFGGHVTLLTTDIAHGPVTWDEDRDVPLVTTLFQNAFGECLVDTADPAPPQSGTPADEPCWADGRQLDRLPQETVLEGDAPHWVMDNKRTGYYLHAGNDALHLLRHRQEWTYCHSPVFLKASAGGFSALHNGPREWDPSLYETTRGDFALGYFEHGSAPRAAQCAYTLMPLSSPQAMAAFAAAMDGSAAAPYAILEQDAQAHIVRDRDTRTTGYVIFDAAWRAAPKDPAHPAAPILLRVNRPCFVMLRDRGAQLEVSVACVDKNRWGVLTRDLISEAELTWRSEPTARDRAAAIELTVAGSWRMARGAPALCTTVEEERVTRASIPYDDFLPIRLTLEPAGTGVPPPR